MLRKWRTAIETSRVGGAIQILLRALATSWIGSFWRAMYPSLADRLPAMLNDAATNSSLQSTHNSVTADIDHATLYRVLQTASSWAQSASVYHWLTKEPEPEVVVIDLRNTYAVGPAIRMADLLFETLAPIYPNSAIASVTTRLQSLVSMIEDRPSIQYITAALEPPAPPSDDDRR